MKSLAAVIVVQLSLSACGAAIPKVVQERWWRLPAEAVERARKMAGVGRVTLRRVERLDLHPVHPIQLYTVRRHHRAILILSEAERQKFRVKIDMLRAEKLKYLVVQVTKANGLVSRFGKRHVISTSLIESKRHPKRGWKSKMVIVPKLEVGDLVELQYGTMHHHDGQTELVVFNHGGENIYQKPWPILEYRYVHTVPADWKVSYKVYNDRARVRELVRDGRRSFQFRRHDLPPLYQEKWRPPLESFAARFCWRLDAYNVSRLRKREKGWADDVVYWTNRLFKRVGRLTKGFDVPAGLSSSRSRRHRLRRAYDYVRRLRFGGWSSSLSRPLAQVLERRTANNLERAVLLFHLLRDADIDAEYLLVRTADRGPLDPAFPVAGRFNHLVLSIPTQRGIDKPLVVDPSCQRCDLGTLPWWSKGTRALRVDAGDPPRVVVVEGREVLPEVIGRRVFLQLSEDGAITGTWKGRFEGTAASNLRRLLNRRGVAEKKKKLAGAVVRLLWKGAQISSHRWSFPADPRDGVRLQVEFEVLGAAQRVGGDTILPLDFMKNPRFDGIHRSRTRVADVAIQRARLYEDRFEITGPPGTSVGVLPRPISVTAGVASYRQTAVGATAGVVIRRSLELKRGRAPRALYVGVQWMLKRAAGILGQALRFRGHKYSQE